MQKPEGGRGEEHGEHPPLFARARFAEHEGEDDAAEGLLFKQTDAEAIEGVERQKLRVAADDRRPLRQRHQREVVDGHREGGQPPKEGNAPPLLRQRGARNARMEGQRQHDGEHRQAQNARAEKVRGLFALEKEFAQPVAGQEHEAHNEDVEDGRALGGRFAKV